MNFDGPGVLININIIAAPAYLKLLAAPDSDNVPIREEKITECRYC